MEFHQVPHWPRRHHHETVRFKDYSELTRSDYGHRNRARGEVARKGQAFDSAFASLCVSRTMKSSNRGASRRRQMAIREEMVSTTWRLRRAQPCRMARATFAGCCPLNGLMRATPPYRYMFSKNGVSVYAANTDMTSIPDPCNSIRSESVR